MSEIINWLRSKPKQEGVRIIWDFGTGLEAVKQKLKEIKDPKDYDEVSNCLNDIASTNATVMIHQDLTLEGLKQAALANYEISSSEYKPYRWETEGRYSLLVDTDDDVRCLIMSDPPKQFFRQDLESVIKRFGWKTGTTN